MTLPKIFRSNLPLKPSQYKVLSEFCNDLAKGLMLGAILGQGVLLDSPPLIRLVMTLLAGAESLLMLVLAVYFAQGG